MSNLKYLISILIILLYSCKSNIYQKTAELNTTDDIKSFKIMFYNVENLFDCDNDSLTRDDDFTPTGAMYWTPKKYFKKLDNIYKTIVAVGKWELPDIVCFAEIENQKVLDALLWFTPLKKADYQIIHKESPDPRGIDVALLYRESSFKPISYKAIPIFFSFDKAMKTREILYVKGETNWNDTLHIFVNHWSSRTEGEVESEPKRITIAQTLRKEIDSIYNIDNQPNIIIVGDFNDYPTNASLHKVLKSNILYDSIKNSELYNLTFSIWDSQRVGSHKFQGAWGMLDQIIVSGNLLNPQSVTKTSLQNVHVFYDNYLLTPDEQFFGYKPFRTFNGMRYLGGFSDHLPVYLDLFH